MDGWTSLFSKHDSTTPLFSFANKTLVGRIVNVHDGDTISVVTSVFDQVAKFQVRLFGIDTCEIKSKSEANQRLAQTAKRRVIQKLIEFYQLPQPSDDDKHFFDNHIIIAQIDCHEFDKYGRLLANVYPLTGYTPNKGDDAPVQFAQESLSTTLLNERLAYVYQGKTKLTEQEQLDLLTKN